MPVILTFSALITTTWSPMSIKGVYFGFSLPIKMRATSDATRPRACPEASTTYHLRAISLALGKYVDILISQKMKTVRRPRVPSTKGAEGAGLPGGQPQNYPTRTIDEEVLHCQRGSTNPLYFLSLILLAGSDLVLVSAFEPESLPASLFAPESELAAGLDLRA